MKLVKVIATKDRQPVFDAPGLKGRKIGYAYLNLQLVVDMDRQEKDDYKRTYVPVRGPSELYPWKNTGEEAWIELANTAPVDEKTHKYILEIDEEGKLISCKQIS